MPTLNEGVVLSCKESAIFVSLYLYPWSSSFHKGAEVPGKSLNEEQYLKSGFFLKELIWQRKSASPVKWDKLKLKISRNILYVSLRFRYCAFLCVEKQMVRKCPICSIAKLSISLWKRGNIETSDEFQKELAHPFLETLKIVEDV